LAAGLVQQHARIEARFKGEFPMFSAQTIIGPGGPGGPGKPLRAIREMES
jgi:hypothetical protein